MTRLDDMCTQALGWAEARTEGELAAAEAVSLEAHLATCGGCRTLAQAPDVAPLLVAAHVDSPDDFTELVMLALPVAPWQRQRFGAWREVLAAGALFGGAGALFVGASAAPGAVARLGSSLLHDVAAAPAMVAKLGVALASAMVADAPGSLAALALLASLGCGAILALARRPARAPRR